MQNSKNKYQERLESLFTEIQRLAVSPAGESPETRRELESMRSRLHELETELTELKNNLSAPQNHVKERTSVPILYEKDMVGFAFADEKMRSMQEFGQSKINSDKTISLPLSASGKEIGELKIESPAGRDLTADELTLANSVADQVSLQIQSLRLLAETERARASAEDATRSFIHENWDNYLDAIHHNERIGYSYDQSAVTPFAKSMDHDLHKNGFTKPVTVMDESIGTLFLRPDPARPFSESDITLINTVASQIGQQVENIRLLADASRARAEAEDASRRLTQDNWGKYIEKAGNQNASLGFYYDTNQVLPIGETFISGNIVMEQPLMVGGEQIGLLSVSGLQNIPQEAKELAASIARQTSIHLETLRLNEELQKRARELQELDRLKSAFLANMSHELRTPLNSILGFADVIIEGLDGPLTENMTNDLGLIQKNGQHLLHLINDVLDMAKIESGKLNLIIEKIKIHDIIEEVTSITSTLASEKNISLFIEPDSNMVVEINADRNRLRQVLINVINNAIKFTENGKIAIHVSHIEEHVLVKIKDTGIGISPEHLENIFIEFTQVDSSTTRKVGGTGLGLPISRRLVEMHGGRLWAESTGVEGEGSTFFIELPIETKIVESEPTTKK